jgi:undecaprenyl-phosphate 4-deoxy-4-formamido-L-arabinose transferase
VSIPDLLGRTETAEQPRVSIVIPCYRDEEAVPTLFARLGPVMDSLDAPAELILVDDGSPDRTALRAIELARDFSHPTSVVRLSRNFGQHPAVFAGFEVSRGDVVVTLDSDLQYPPEEIPRLIEQLAPPEYPVVSGFREQRRDRWSRRQLTRLMSHWLGRQTGSPLKDYGSMFRAYDRSVIEQLLRFRERRRYIPSLVGWLGVGVREIPVAHDARGEQGSRYRLRPLVDMLLDMVTGYSTFPLRTVTLAGMFASLLGFVATVGLGVYRIFVGAGVSGLVSAFAVLFFLIGVQLFLLALIGEYVGRIYIEAKSRPYYLVAEVTTNR